MTRATARTDVRPATAPRPRTTAPRAVEPRPDLRLVPPTKPAVNPKAGRRPAGGPKNRRAPFVLLVVALLAGTTLGLLILNTAIAVDSLKATQLRAENAQRAQEVQRLEQQVVTGNTPAGIAEAALAAGLVPAGPAAYLVIGPDGTAELRGTPRPAEAPDPEGSAGDGD
ncbi:hypothetical protein [Blastococcus sp. PRF04-17]|uniref:hypothetical protein n=1 Tax=Blastococcus sp. PRF04-17 TaxID=2933797 RepID=UPI001FF62032|nr:hypothetical protein [Blastococcus sp. PRF04-17]UOY02915.1 hypothetical protein MVA48_06050 [Blastococcus sp. PRF04-17]